MIILKFINQVIRLYQITLSPDHGVLRVFFPHGACRYQPTCSHYMQQAISRHRWAGLIIGIKRVLRCHPYATGGHDPLAD